VTSVTAGQALTYTITVTNAGPSAVVGAAVTDTMPASLTSVTWTCAPALSCGAASGSGNIATTVSLANGGSATFTVNATVATTATGSVVNTATVAPPGGTTDGTPGNNSATDTDTIVLPLPTIGLLDNFNRTNANTLNNGTNWSQVAVVGASAIRVNANQAFAILPGWAIWNSPTGGFGNTQGAAFTFASTPATGSFLVLKGTGGSANTPANYIRVFYGTAGGGTVTVATTTNSGFTNTTRGTFTGVGFVNGDTLSAVADATGTVFVWKTSGTTVTYLGSVAIPTSGTGAWTQGTGGGRIGLMLPINARVDNFAGGTLP